MDPSDVYRPDVPDFTGKDASKFRDYAVTENDPIRERVFQTYAKMHRNQTVEFVKGIESIYSFMKQIDVKRVKMTLCAFKYLKM